jgi:F0F1-type ATP synthase assembly protein I
MDEPTPPTPEGQEPEPRWAPADRRLSPGATAFLGLGISMALCVAVTVGAGLGLDAVTHDTPVFLLIGLAVGIMVAVGMAVATVRKYL